MGMYHLVLQLIIILLHNRHIPKASGSTMKNIMNFCFNLKRAEKVYGEAVSLTAPFAQVGLHS